MPFKSRNSSANEQLMRRNEESREESRPVVGPQKEETVGGKDNVGRGKGVFGRLSFGKPQQTFLVDSSDAENVVLLRNDDF